MSEILKSLSRHTLVYGAGTLLSRAAGFFMIPIYTRYLLPGTMESWSSSTCSCTWWEF